MEKPDPREARFLDGLQLLYELSEKGIVIIVEGPKDVTALRELGLIGPILTLAGKSLVQATDKLATTTELLILFDFDPRGNQLARQLTKLLQGRGVSVLTDIRRKLRRAFSWRIRVIEGLKLPNTPPKGARF